MTTAPITHPTNASCHTNPDGTVTVTYGTYRGNDRVELGEMTYTDGREASIESLLAMFPGTSREFLERAHKR